MNRFKIYPNSSVINKTAAPNEVRALVDEFIQEMAKNLSPSKQKMAKSLINDRGSAQKLMTFVGNELANIQAEYDDAVKTYSLLLSRVSQNHLEGRILKDFDDLPILNPGRQSSFSSAKKRTMSDMYQVWTDQPFRLGNWDDFRDSLLTLRFQKMAETFATIEVYLKFNLTNSLKLDISQMTGDLPAFWDVHATGGIYRLYLHSKFYQGLATGLIACLDRLGRTVDLEGANVGAKTVFHLRSEFDRSPDSNSGNSSTHNPINCHESFFSNMTTDGPHIIGNIDSKSGHLAGKPLAFASGKILEYKNIYSTVQKICGLTPDRNFEPLLERVGSQLKPRTNECKNT
jgi:hypothetical protein